MFNGIASSHRHTGHRQTGATLVELVISVVVLSVSVIGIMTVISRTTVSSADPLVRVQALAIAQAYMEEILSQPTTDPAGSDTNSCENLETRATYDDVTDYDCITDEPATNQDGVQITQLAGYKVSVDVDATTSNGVSARKILVTVTFTPTGLSLPITAYRFN